MNEETVRYQQSEKLINDVLKAADNAFGNADLLKLQELVRRFLVLLNHQIEVRS
jgi:hypothetical protein